MKPSPAKAILAILLCQVLSITQVFAIAGGPPTGTGGFGGGGTTLNLTGTYSGVLQGVTETTPNGGGNDTAPPIPGDPNPPPVSTSTTAASNSIGLFDLGVTQTTGLATGNFLLFSDGRVFTGTITGAVNPGSGSLQGVLQASFNFTVSTISAGAVVSTPITATAFGRLDTVISGATANTGTPSTTGGTSTASTTTALVTLAGTASLDLNFGDVDPTTLQPIIDRTLTFSVNGFRNSTSTTAVTVLTATTATGG